MRFASIFTATLAGLLLLPRVALGIGMGVKECSLPGCTIKDPTFTGTITHAGTSIYEAGATHQIGDETDACVAYTFGLSGATDPVMNVCDNSVDFSTPITATVCSSDDDPGNNKISLFDNDTGASTCSDNGVLGEFTVTDKDATGADEYVACKDSTEIFNFHEGLESDGGIPNSGTATECLMLDAGAAIVPSSGGAATGQVDDTNFSYRVLDFDDTSDENAYWSFELPANFAGFTASVTPVWTVAACTADTADDVCWIIDGGGIADDEAWDGGTLDGSETAGQDVCSAADDLMVGPTIAFTHLITISDDRANFKITRDADLGHASCAGDNNDVSGDVRLLAVRFCYEVNNIFSGE
jgi:hypothetical protein